MPSVNRRERRLLLHGSAILCAAMVLSGPLSGRSAFDVRAGGAAASSRTILRLPPRVAKRYAIHIARDPFVADQPERPVPAGAGVLGRRVVQGAPIGYVLPPNQGAGGTPLASNGSAVQVTAIVSGTSPRALVDDGLSVRVVAVGDAVAGSRVIAIDPSGVRLQNGTVLPLDERVR